MTDWDGADLPPAARARLARFGAGSARTSLLSVASAVSVGSVGLTPIGEVMGCIVQHMGWQGWGGCGVYAFNTFLPSTVTSGSGSRYAGYRPYVDALYRGYDTAMSRLLEEATALGADGVVGIRLAATSIGEGNREFTALGTAVRAETSARPGRPFTTELTGPDVQALMLAGWFPAGMAYGIAVAVRHDDYVTRQQRSWGAPNVEVIGYTDLVTHVRADAREQLRRRVSRFGGEGCVGVRSSLQIREIEPGEGHRDHIAESTFFGSAVVRFSDRGRQPSALTVLPLRPMPTTRPGSTS